MAYEFSGNKFDTEEAMVNFMASSWLANEGKNDDAVIAEILRLKTDQDLTEDLWEEWGYYCTHEVMDAAFARYRAEFEAE